MGSRQISAKLQRREPLHTHMFYSYFRFRLQPPSPKTFSALTWVPLEKLCYVFTKEKCASKFQDFVRTLKFSTYGVLKDFNPRKVFSPIFTEIDLKLLSEFSRSENIIVSRPNRGRGVVITNKTNYIDSMLRIL